MTKREIALARKNGTLDSVYEELVNKLIRRRYSVSNEFAVLRQRDTKREDFVEYNGYVESCKAEAKALLGFDGSEE